MKAYNLHDINKLIYEDVKIPDISNEEVLLKVKACGICSSDIPRVYENGTYHFPTIIGHEFSGIIEQVKNDKYKDLIGKKTAVFPLIPCFNCDNCKNKKYQLCTNYNYLGSRCDGGLAEYVKVPVWNCVIFPDDVDFEVIALMEPMCVAMHSINIIKDKNLSSKIAINGTGIISLLIYAILKYYGYENVVIITNSDNKKMLLENFDIKNKKIRDAKEKYDYVFEVVGNNESISNSINIANTNSSIILVGNPKSDVLLNKNIYWKILRNELKIFGSWNSSYKTEDENDDIEKVKKIIIDNKIDVKKFITHKFDKDNVIKAFELMKEKKEPYIKVMTIWD